MKKTSFISAARLSVLLCCACDSLWDPWLLSRGPECAFTIEGQCSASVHSSCWQQPVFDLIDPNARPGVDILFVVDNSSSMSPKQAVLAKAIPQFIQEIDATGVNYHIGFTTTDIGTLPTSGSFPGPGDNRCNTPSGDDGKLQNIPCTTRALNPDYYTSPEFREVCNGNAMATPPIPALCPDPSYVPMDHYLAKIDGVHNIAGHAGDPDAVKKAFQCIALVGDGGCGVESPLEAARRALDGHLSENDGFLRPRSTLAVIYLTDEDDCSIRLDQRYQADPNPLDCPVSEDPDYRCYGSDFRCMAKDLECAEPLDVIGAKTQCHERANSWLEPLIKYTRFFSKLRVNSRLILAGIWSPSTLDFDLGRTTPFGSGQLQVVNLEVGSGKTSTLNRGQKTQAACYNPDSTLTTDPKGYFGQAQLRLKGFLSSFDPRIALEQSICDVGGYATLFNQIAGKLARTALPNCLSLKPAQVESRANCIVGYVDAAQPLPPPAACLPQCTSACCQAWGSVSKPSNQDPTIIAACMPEPTDCYCAVESQSGACPLTAVGAVWRQGNSMPPAGQVAYFSCD